MHQLSAPKAPEWRDVADGIRVRLRYGPTEARNAARRHVRAVMEKEPTADPQFAFVVGCLIWGVVEWEGVAAPLPPMPEGETADSWAAQNPPTPAELTPEHLDALLTQRPDIYDDLDLSYVEEVVAALAEKKGSRPSPSGISAAAPATAKAATGPAGKRVRTRKTPRKPKPAKGSGEP